MVHLWSSPGVLYSLYAAIMYALFPCCAFCISCSFRLFCCTVRVFGASSCRDFLRRSILPRKSTRFPSYSALQHCKGGRLCSRTPFWEAVLCGEMQLCCFLSPPQKGPRRQICVKLNGVLSAVLFNHRLTKLLACSQHGPSVQGRVCHRLESATKGYVAERLW